MASAPDDPQTATPPTDRHPPLQLDDTGPEHILAADPSDEDAREDLADQMLVERTAPMAAPVLPSDRSDESADARAARRRVDRQMADLALVAALRRDNFKGVQYDRFASDLSRYGLSVMNGWLRTGHAFTLLNDRGLKVSADTYELEELALEATAREEVAIMTVATALPTFRERALLGGAWNPQKGASITTYFMGACILALANVLRERRRQRSRWARQDECEGTLHKAGRGPEDVAAFVVGREQLRARLASYKPRERRIIAASLVGYSQVEIAEMYDEASDRAVEAVLFRWRTKEKKRSSGHPGGEKP